MKLFTDIWELMQSLRFVDIIFFFAVLVLMILIVTLIYFIRINKDEKEINMDETAEMKIVREIRGDKMNSGMTINFTDYEKDQEDKAIISYDELLNKSNKYELNYENEEYLDDLSVKKVNLDNLNNSKNEATPKFEGRVISFAKEEAFLQALKQLQKELG